MGGINFIYVIYEQRHKVTNNYSRPETGVTRAEKVFGRVKKSRRGQGGPC